MDSEKIRLRSLYIGAVMFFIGFAFSFLIVDQVKAIESRWLTANASGAAMAFGAGIVLYAIRPGLAQIGGDVLKSLAALKFGNVGGEKKPPLKPE